MPRILPGAALGAVVCLALAVSGGCVQRPVAATRPITRTNFTTTIAETAIDKIDLLFDIDNSASMGDKQTFLARAVPDLITRLVTPNCVDENDTPNGKAVASDGTCTAGKPEFAPVRDIHIGIVSSSLGPRLGDQCGADDQIKVNDTTTIQRHNDDQGHLLDRAGALDNPTAYGDSPLGDAHPDNLLDWYPGAATGGDAGLAGQHAIVDATTLKTDFASLVVGVHAFGCGIESQLESWYRFLVQPDPYAKLVLDKNNIAQWEGVDTTILAQRADFLRPDSLVAVIVLSDENDSEVDVRSLGGHAWQFMKGSMGPPRGTAVCADHPEDPGCTSCGFPGHAADPACKLGNYDSGKPSDWAVNLNLRHVHEKQKYGVSVQFPIERYVLGLTSPKVPDRDAEYPKDESGNYPSSYQGLKNLKCINPLFAAHLPAPPPGTKASDWQPTADDLCNLVAGNRRKDLVFYAHIGGVPHQLLQNSDGTQKSPLRDADWQLILGRDPEKEDYAGIDPHMVESFAPRTSVQVPTGGFPVAPPTAPDGTDPISGREWITDSTAPAHAGAAVDLEYACTFRLTNGEGKAVPRDCGDAAVNADQALRTSCECASPATGPSGAFTPFTPGELPAVCNSAAPNSQVYAKAYPTIRELLLAKLLGQVQDANQGIVSSLCPIHTSDQSSDGKSDPLFGYRPAMNSIVDALSKQLHPQCLPERLKPVDDDGGLRVPCLILGTFPGPDAPTDCSQVPGYSNVEPSVLAHFKDDHPDTSMALTCQLDQLPPNTACDTGTVVGWCYVDDGSRKGCPQSIVFTPGALVRNVVTNLQCLEASNTDLGDASR